MSDSTHRQEQPKVDAGNFPQEEFIQGKPVSFGPQVEGLGVASGSVSHGLEGPRERPDAAIPSEGLGNSDQKCKRAPFLIELFCGTAGVCAQFRTLGGRALGIDHHLKRTKLKSAAVKLDLNQQWVQDLIMREISSGRVDAVHMGPPCGTSSRARNIPIKKKLRKAGAPNPAPLRSSKFPEGFPWLKGINLIKVEAANSLYDFAAKVALLCDEHGVLFTVENPANSFMWETKFFKRLVDRFFFHIVDACEYGSEHKKATAFLANFSADRLRQRCTGNHTHKSWNVEKAEDGSWRFDTAKEAEYPTKLAKQLALALFDKLLESQQFKLQDNLEDHAPKVSSEAQPRRPKGPLLLTEFKTKVVVSCDPEQVPPETIPEAATPPLQGIPVGSKRLDVQPVFNEKGEKVRLSATYGIFYNPEEFIQRALQLEHPSDTFLPIDDANMEAIRFILREGPVKTAQHRTRMLNHFLERAKSLQAEEARLHESLDQSIRPVLATKRLLLFREMLVEAGVDDPQLFDDLRFGFRLVGDLQPSGQFQPQWKPASLDVEQLKQTAVWAQRAVIASCRKGLDDLEMAQAVWDETMVQTMPDKQWVKGPFTAEQITQRLGPSWVPSRRFGVRQNGKIRPVDDFSQFLINATVSCHEKIDLEGLDHICSTARFFMGASTEDGDMRAAGDKGSAPCKRAPEWSASDAKDIFGRCLDLRQAYKQLVRHPCDAWAAVLAVPCPTDGTVYFFEAIALPFGAVSSVLAFNRAARALRTILSRVFKLATTNFFDDFCQLELGLLKESAWKTAETVMQLLGWKISSGEDKRKPFSKSFEILGAVVSFKSFPIDVIEVCNKESRLAQLEEHVAELRKSLHTSISRTQLESIKGRLLYAAGHTFGRCTQLACQLLHRLGGAGPSIKVTPELVYAVSEALEALNSAGPRTIKPWEGMPPVLIFSDGAVENEGATVTHGALLVDPALNLRCVFGDHVPQPFVTAWARAGKRQVIAQAEMFPVLAAKCTWKKQLSGRSIIWFLDNESARMAFVRCFSPVIDNYFMLQLNSKFDLELQTRNWYSRVPSKSNPSDSASRLSFTEYQHCHVQDPCYERLLKSLSDFESLMQLLERGGG